MECGGIRVLWTHSSFIFFFTLFVYMFWLEMLEFLIDNIFVEFGGLIFQQTVSIPMDTNCAPLLANLFLYSYEAEFIQNLLKDKTKNHLAKSFNFTFRYINDVLSLNNPHFSEASSSNISSRIGN